MWDYEHVFEYGFKPIAGKRVVHLGSGFTRPYWTHCGERFLGLIVHPKKLFQTQAGSVFMKMAGKVETRLCRRCMRTVKFTEYQGKKVVLFKRDGRIVAMEKVNELFQSDGHV